MEDIKKVVKGINLKVAVTEDTHHNYTWSFRYIDPAKAANEVEEDRAFLIESNVEPKGNKGESIAPTNAAWLKNQNNCLVLSDPEESEFEEARQAVTTLLSSTSKRVLLTIWLPTTKRSPHLK